MLRLIKGGSGDSEASARTHDDLGVSELDFELPNAGAGPDPLALSAFAADNDAIVLLFQRDYHCRNCRQQVRDVADRYGEFRERDAAVVSVLPESAARARKWQTNVHLPFPLVADEEKAVAEQYGQPTRFGKLGGLHDLVGRMPEVAILDARGDDLRLFGVHRGDKPADRPSVDDVLAMLDRMLADEE
ncbi:peroxiredoxin family protein [Halorussus pelagicus]|uniref:peroxiredoxin family protein n=1 Tax=Halorussus pelagicus TaxID=2505977 RepID=UPI001FB796B5|nr:redoxin domain-containing protein [Halorussus pelagicus]